MHKYKIQSMKCALLSITDGLQRRLVCYTTYPPLTDSSHGSLCDSDKNVGFSKYILDLSSKCLYLLQSANNKVLSSKFYVQSFEAGTIHCTHAKK